MKWTLIGDSTSATTPTGEKLRITTTSVGVGSMGKGQALSLMTTERGWKVLDFAWFQTDGGYHSWRETGKTMHASPIVATNTLKAAAKYLFPATTKAA